MELKNISYSDMEFDRNLWCYFKWLGTEETVAQAVGHLIKFCSAALVDLYIDIDGSLL